MSFTNDSVLSGVCFNIWSIWSSSDLIHFPFKNTVPNKNLHSIIIDDAIKRRQIYESKKHGRRRAGVDIQLVE